MALAFLAILWSSCASPQSQTIPVSLSELRASLNAPAVTADAVRVSVTILDADGERLRLPSVVAKVESPARIEEIREVLYPTTYDLPAIEASEANFHPASPSTFTNMNTGWTIDFTPRRKGNLVELSGRMVFATFDRMIDASGDALGPIADDHGVQLSSGSRMPVFTTYITPLVLIGSLNKPHRMEVNHPDKKTRAIITVEAFGS